MGAELQKLKGQRVMVGLSGGVDSAVAAWLLKNAGADVHGLHMTNWEDDDGYCTAAADLQDARQVASQLDIPLHPANFSRDYRLRVFDHFLDEYRRGRTPNPDVLCNREIKFGVFRDYARRLGATRLATGHYARIQNAGKDCQLLKGKDPNKDQSYFLHAVSADALADTVFPLGHLDKTEVRSIAREQGLAVHDKRDSTGICFIGERPFREFLARYCSASSGAVETPDGRVVGTHTGLMYYTLGQRQGIGIGGRSDSRDQPWYVVAKDTHRNVLLVDQGDCPLLYCEALIATDVHWINGVPAELRARTAAGPLLCTAKIRYRQPDQVCRVSILDTSRLTVEFAAPQRAAAPGQYVVFYQDERCLGGAVIDQVLEARAYPQASSSAA